MMDDQLLLARYAKEGSEEAFAELARRHTALVYSAAIRQVRDPQWAEDVTQTVFVQLARRAGSISPSAILAGWLHTTTRYTALDLLRRENRRRRREQLSFEMNAPMPEPSPGWKEIRPLLDEALTQLPAADRDALLLRFFEQKDFAGVGAALGASAEAARKRVDRALDRLRDYLGQRGVTTTAAALGGALTAHAIEVVPASLAAAVAAGSMAAAGGGAGWFSSLFVMTNAKMAVGTALVAGVLAVPLVLQQNALGVAEADQARLKAQLAQRPAAPVTPIVDTSDKVARDRADLARLRAEAQSLAAKTAELSAQALALWEERAARYHRPGSTPVGRCFSVKDNRDAGTATPADTMQTFVWAMLNKDTNRLSQLFAVDPQTNGKSDQDALDAAVSKIAREATGLEEKERAALDDMTFYVSELQPGPNDDQWVVVTTGQGDGSLHTSRVQFRPGPGGWQWVIGTNGPVEEPLTN